MALTFFEFSRMPVKICTAESRAGPCAKGRGGRRHFGVVRSPPALDITGQAAVCDSIGRRGGAKHGGGERDFADLGEVTLAVERATPAAEPARRPRTAVGTISRWATAGVRPNGSSELLVSPGRASGAASGAPRSPGTKSPGRSPGDGRCPGASAACTTTPSVDPPVSTATRRLSGPSAFGRSATSRPRRSPAPSSRRRAEGHSSRGSIAAAAAPAGHLRSRAAWPRGGGARPPARPPPPALARTGRTRTLSLAPRRPGHRPPPGRPVAA